MFQVVVIDADGTESAEIDGNFLSPCTFYFEFESRDVIRTCF